MIQTSFVTLSRVFSRAILPLFLLASGTTGAWAQEAELRISTQRTPLYAPLYVAKNQGWLNEELAKSSPGTKAVINIFDAGAPVNESFASGLADIGTLGDTPFTVGAAAGIERRIIGKASDGPQTIAVITAYDSKIRTPADLKGKKVAVPKATYTEHLLALVLERGGLTFKDIQYVNLLNSDVAPAIVAGDVDAGAVWEPFLTKFESAKSVRVLADGTGLKAGISGIVASPEALKTKRNAIKAFFRAYERGRAYILSNPVEAGKLIAKDVNLSPELTTQVLKKLDFKTALTPNDINEFRKTAEYIHKIGIIRRQVNIDAIVDLSITQELGLK
ncbi:MAG: aliphatic sulfonate ABC transporter substrate-binding protein [Zoogloeaceae bacterium]|jgi:sulfonate transport system substrate-binding protein|nr:aliphatic sulfonate ABC transporter substrate-binding protein [Zoogloeaceae bacterium]